jgi:hypothetical protein
MCLSPFPTIQNNSMRGHICPILCLCYPHPQVVRPGQSPGGPGRPSRSEHCTLLSTEEQHEKAHFRLTIECGGCSSDGVSDILDTKLTWPRPPFQPCTAMTVCSGLMMPRLRATRRPYLYGISECPDNWDSPNTVVHIDLPLVPRNAAGLGVENRVNPAG